ncbi:hypothetical protein IscW_ISCW005435 [Ixodes scapularis]|uniref:F-box domain-containing protein n=1 Tax=Ixodes scapularis TaxID=6945 RepID=B7PLC2_IXOSC|nr:hypothetical protein IscW_ISCW005435 [Ixodes scapularis]|eukprot:XP_002434570.1 hypothetical protein IscW_ISCW005435 [Ixodes scapularis]
MSCQEEVLRRAEDASERGVSELLSLPDLALYEICAALSCPFDLLSLGCTCRRLHEVSSSRSLWLSLSLKWCSQLWHWLDFIPSEEEPKAWLLQLLHNDGNLKCQPDVDETWERVEDPRFACQAAMLRRAYTDMDIRVSPLVLHRRWLYDMALYRRRKPKVRFCDPELSLSDLCVSALASLGRASEGDLRRRKQPHINPRYYIKRIDVSRHGWTDHLFPSGPRGSICPMLTCPSIDGYSEETSGVYGLVACVSRVLVAHLKPSCLEGKMSLSALARTVRRACAALERRFAGELPRVRERWRSHPVAHAIVSMAEHGWPDLSAWQEDLDGLGLSWREVMAACIKLLARYRWLDAVVDETRRAWRGALMPQVLGVVGRDCVARLNLTDCDVIGGDNQRQEMASAAFVSASGALGAKSGRFLKYCLDIEVKGDCIY